MQTPAQVAERLLGALEELAQQERFLLDSGAVDQALAVQEREQPLLQKLAEMLERSDAVSTPALRARGQALLAAQTAQIERLASQKRAIQAELQQLRAAQTRVQQLRPAYGQGTAESSFAGTG